jgi:RNA polymerase sigma factor (sigma-70 family)
MMDLEEHLFKEYRPMVIALANKWHRALPSNSQHTREDMQQEAWVKLLEIIINSRYKPSRGASMNTWLGVNISNHLCSIVRSERRLKRASIGFVEDMEFVEAHGVDQLDYVCVKQEIERLAEQSVELACLIAYGVPSSLVNLIKSKNRIKSMKTGKPLTDMRFTVSKSVVEKYIGARLKKFCETT